MFRHVFCHSTLNRPSGLSSFIMYHPHSMKISPRMNEPKAMPSKTIANDESSTARSKHNNGNVNTKNMTDATIIASPLSHLMNPIMMKTPHLPLHQAFHL